jgi:hypothetical protein
MRFPLSTTAAELVELCGPDTYRIYALDELGEVLDFVTTIQASRARNANLPDVPLGALRAAHDPAPTTDLRYALHALTEIARINGEAAARDQRFASGLDQDARDEQGPATQCGVPGGATTRGTGRRERRTR